MFDRSLLPPPETFYRQEFSRMSRPSRGWAQTRCCFHEDRTPSLSLNLREGHFVCHGCGAKGGDIVSFVMQRDGVDFRRACEGLGAWTDQSDEATREVAGRQKEAERIKRVAEELASEEKRLRLSAAHQLRQFEKLSRDISERMEKSAGEELETCWAALALLQAEIREQSAIHDLLSFGPKELRTRYVLNEDVRPDLIAEFQLTGMQ